MKEMRTRLLKAASTLIAAGMAIFTMVTPLFANDAIRATVLPSPPGLTVDENGAFWVPGTYAVGTLKVFEIVSADEWPDVLGPVRVCLDVVEGKPKPPTNYTVPIELRPVGGDLDLTPNPMVFDVDSSNWGGDPDGCSVITVEVPQAILDDPDYRLDGTQLVGIIQIEPTGPGYHLDTVTTIKIYATLYHPLDTSCLRTVTFPSDNGYNVDLSTSADKFAVTYKLNPSFSLQGVNPSQTRYNVLVINSCNTAENFDLKLAIDPQFDVPTTGQPVKWYDFASVTVDTVGELKSQALGTATNTGGVYLCIGNLSVASNHTIYTSVDIVLDSSTWTMQSALPAVDTEYDGFTADVLSHTSPTACSDGTHPDSDGQSTTSAFIRSVTCQAAGCP